MKPSEPQVRHRLGITEDCAYIDLEYLKQERCVLTFDPLNIILIAAAVLIFWRLKSVLGQRTGLERPPFVPPAKSPPDLRVVENPQIIPPSAVWQGIADDGSQLAKGLDAIANQQKDFNVTGFIAGAKSAYEMILEAFAKGDTASLKPLLAKPVYDSFAATIDESQKQKQSKVFQFVGMKSTTLKRATLENKRASITVQFVSEMISATLDKNGATVEGDAKTIAEVTDVWTFERDVTSRDPNWKLVSTDDPVE
jgi:predicted lipid-binding transport protein (Tim44 family)